MLNFFKIDISVTDYHSKTRLLSLIYVIIFSLSILFKPLSYVTDRVTPKNKQSPPCNLVFHV